MPWKEVEPMEERLSFILRVKDGGVNFSSICKEYGVSRKTGYELLRRYRAEGMSGLSPRSRRPQHSPKETSSEMICEIVAIRTAHPFWGGSTIREILLRRFDSKLVPTARTIDRVLKRCGMVQSRRKKKRCYPNQQEKVIKPSKPNDVWTVDFKGWWLTKDGKRCVPLTIRDEYSRYLLDLSALTHGTTKAVKRRFELCFECYGVPNYIRSDNGSPFASYNGLRRLSSLSVWWIKHGAIPNYIPPASPQYNGAHERLHRDIKAEIQKTPARNLKTQQEVFTAWQDDFNHYRPHQALKKKTPGEVYSPSTRSFNKKADEYDYEEEVELRKVTRRGNIWWRGSEYFISNSLRGEYIGIEKENDITMSLWYRNFFLGKTDVDFSHPLGDGKASK